MENKSFNPIAEAKEHEPIRVLNLFIRFKNAFFQMWLLVIAMAILLGGLFWYHGRRTFVPMYESKAIFTVDSGYTAEDIFGTGAYYDQYAAQQLAATFPQILSTDMMRDLVVQQLEKGYINGVAHATAVADSNMLVLTVTGNNPRDIYDYLCAIIECYPQVAVFMIEYPQVKIVTPPEVPTEPYNTFSDFGAIFKGAAIGTAVALLFILLCALLTRTVQTTEELKTAVNIPILVALPKVVLKKRRSGSNSLITADSDPNMTESIRGLRMKVKKLVKEKEKKTILVTSTLAGEGKTTVAINLAASLVRDGHKVILVDADLHSQSVARSLDEKTNHDGMMDCLGENPLPVMSCIRHNESMNIDFISGNSTEKRHYSMDLNQVRKLLDELTHHYDYIIIDTPPNDVVSDAMALCRCANCVLYVVRQDHVQRSQVINSIATMYAKGIKIDGCIFNGVPKFHRQYGYGYRYGYGYGYDYGHKKYRYGSKYNYQKYDYTKYSSYSELVSTLTNRVKSDNTSNKK